MIPAEAVEAGARIVYRTSGRKRVMSYEQARSACEDDARSILEAAAPYMLSHFANRISWRCSECEDQIDAETALRKLQEEAGN